MKLAVGFILFEDATAKYLADFLPSLEKALGFLQAGSYQVYAIDNSQLADTRNIQVLKEFETSVEKAREERLEIDCQRTGENIGFSRAYNLMLSRAVAKGAEYFFIINPDTLLEEDSISLLVAALETEGSLGSVAPKIRRWDFSKREKTNLIDSQGIILVPGLNFYDFGQGTVDQNETVAKSILGPSGAAGLYRLSALEDVARRTGSTSPVQYYDEHFFMYKEDCDLAYRLFLAGHRSRLVPEAIIYHDRTAASSGAGLAAVIRDRRSKSRLVKTWSLRNQLYIYRKYWSKQNLLSKLAILLRLGLSLIYSLILEKYLLKEFWENRPFKRG